MTRPVTLDALDAVELGEALEMLAGWLDADPTARLLLADHLDPDRHGGDPAGDVVVDLVRLASLLPGTDPSGGER